MVGQRKVWFTQILEDLYGSRLKKNTFSGVSRGLTNSENVGEMVRKLPWAKTTLHDFHVMKKGNFLSQKKKKKKKEKTKTHKKSQNQGGDKGLHKPREKGGGFPAGGWKG